jgi:polar amino acid transport system substrate-binding protein
MGLSKKYWFLTLFILCIHTVTAAASSNKLSISLLNFCPLHCIGSDNQLILDRPGYAVEIYQKIFESSGYDVNFQIAPFNRGMIEVNKGRIDAISGPLKFDKEALKVKIRQEPLIGPLYGELIYPQKSVGIHHSSCVFVHSDANWEFTDLTSLDGKIIGAGQSYDYGTETNLYLENRLINDKDTIILLTGNSVFAKNLKKLEHKRIDVVLMDKVSGKHAIQTAVKQGKLEQDSVKLLGCSGIPASLFLAFSGHSPDKSKQLAKFFDNGIKVLRESGQLKEILSKYELQDWSSLLADTL